MIEKCNVCEFAVDVDEIFCCWPNDCDVKPGSDPNSGGWT